MYKEYLLTDNFKWSSYNNKKVIDNDMSNTIIKNFYRDYHTKTYPILTAWYNEKF